MIRICLLILLTLNSNLFSCTYLKQIIERIHKKPTIIQDRDYDAVRKKVATLIQDGDYTEAVDIINIEVKKGKHEITYDGLYVASINGLVENGMKYYAEGDYGSAGIAFTKAIENFPSSRSLIARIKSSPNEMKSYIKTLTERLMEDGLKEYRDGNLKNAISTWQKIVKYDPNHIEANKMIDITTIQINNLKAIE
jgi:tetratricopeptide (TPR) repeat protein